MFFKVVFIFTKPEYSLRDGIVKLILRLGIDSKKVAFTEQEENQELINFETKWQTLMQQVNCHCASKKAG